MKLLTIVVSGAGVLEEMKDGAFINCELSKKETASSMLQRDVAIKDEVIIQVEVQSMQEVFMPEQSLKIRDLK